MIVANEHILTSDHACPVFAISIFKFPPCSWQSWLSIAFLTGREFTRKKLLLSSLPFHKHEMKFSQLLTTIEFKYPNCIRVQRSNLRGYCIARASDTILPLNDKCPSSWISRKHGEKASHVCILSSQGQGRVQNAKLANKKSIIVIFFPCIGVVQGWAAIAMGVLSGSIPWYTMMVLHKRSALLQKVDDTLAVFHTHAVAGLLGGALTGLFAEPTLCSLFLSVTNSKGAFYGSGMQFIK